AVELPEKLVPGVKFRRSVEPRNLRAMPGRSAAHRNQRRRLRMDKGRLTTRLRPVHRRGCRRPRSLPHLCFRPPRRPPNPPRRQTEPAAPEEPPDPSPPAPPAKRLPPPCPRPPAPPPPGPVPPFPAPPCARPPVPALPHSQIPHVPSLSHCCAPRHAPGPR